MKKVTYFFVLLIIIILLLIVLYINTDLFKTKEMLFWKYGLKQKDNIVEVLSDEEIKSFDEKLKESAYIKQGSITLEAENNLIQTIKLNFNEKGNENIDVINSEIQLLSNDKQIATFNFIKSDDFFLLNSNENNKQYLGFENKNLKQLVQKMGINNAEYIPNEIKEIDYYELFKINEEDKKYLQKKYIPELRKYINNKNYKKIENISKQKLKNIEIRDTKHIDIYEMKISEEEFYSSIVDVLEIVKDDYRTLNMISQKLAIINNENENTDIEAIKNYINNVISIIRKKEYSDKDFIYVLLYKKENEIVRTELCIKNNRTIAIEARDNQIIINQYDVKSNLADVKSFNGIINIVLNNITEIIINKKINNDIYDTSINIECNLGIDIIRLKYVYRKELVEEINGLIGKDNVNYVDLNTIEQQDCREILENILKVKTVYYK